MRDERLFTILSADDLASLPAEGWIGSAVEQLKAEREGVSGEERARALRLLYRLHKEVS